MREKTEPFTAREYLQELDSTHIRPVTIPYITIPGKIPLVEISSEYNVP